MGLQGLTRIEWGSVGFHRHYVGFEGIGIGLIILQRYIRFRD